MAEFPCLPVHPPDSPWSPHVHTAYSLLKNMFDAASLVCGTESDEERISYHINHLLNSGKELLEALEEYAEHTSSALPITWVHQCATAIGTLAAKLMDALAEAHER
jgi:hypothetical protein